MHTTDLPQFMSLIPSSGCS